MADRRYRLRADERGQLEALVQQAVAPLEEPLPCGGYVELEYRTQQDAWHGTIWLRHELHSEVLAIAVRQGSGWHLPWVSDRAPARRAASSTAA